MAITIGLRTNTHLIICSETTLASSIIKIKDDEEYCVKVADTLVALTGNQGDTFRTMNFVQQYSKLLSMTYKEKIGPELLSRVLSTKLHKSLRKQQVDTQGIIAGRSEDNTLKLYCVDRYGALYEDDFVVTGYGLYFVFGVFDMYYKKDMNEEEAFRLIQDCLKVLKERLVLETDKWKMDVIGPDGFKTQYIDLK
ncbi:Proteasome subunit beta type-2 [Glugoides intestinalis]